MAHNRYALSVVGRDRPGIVAAVSHALTQSGCNIEDSSMAMLRGVFAMLLVISVPIGQMQTLRARLATMGKAEGLTVHLDGYPEGAKPQSTGDLYTLSVHGADHPGIVAAVTGLLAHWGINIIDLSTRVIEGQVPVYVMTMELTVPPTVDVERLAEQLRALSEEIKCTVSLELVETFSL